MDNLSTSHFPARLADSLGWPDTVRASRDFFVTNFNYFAVIHRWQFDSIMIIEPCIGAHRGKEIELIKVGVTYLSGSAAVNDYVRLKARDSLWTLLAETKFWFDGPEVWEAVIRNPNWMFDRYHRTIRWAEYLRLEPFNTSITPKYLSQWQFVIGLLANSSSQSLLAGQSTNSATIYVNGVWSSGRQFFSIISRRDGFKYFYQAIAGTHFADSIVYRKLWAKPRIVEGLEYDHYEHLRRADSLWVLIDSTDWLHSDSAVHQIYYDAAKFYDANGADVFVFPRAEKDSSQIK
jgi:hypothetical protein